MSLTSEDSKAKRGSRSGSRSKGRSYRGKAQEDMDAEFAYLFEDEMKNSEDQEKLTEEQLEDVIIRSLSSIDPLRPKGSCIWDPDAGDFVTPPSEDLCIHIFHRDSELQLKGTKHLDETKPGGTDTTPVATDEKSKLEEKKQIQVLQKSKVPPKRGKKEKDDEEEDTVDPDDHTTSYGSQKVIVNQFHYVERPTQCYYNPMRNQSTQTPTRGKGVFEALVNPWTIHDAYESNREIYEMEQLHKAKAATDTELEGDHQSSEFQGSQSEKSAAIEEDGQKIKKQGTTDERERTNVLKEVQIVESDDQSLQQQEEEDISEYCVEALRILERLVMQNVYSDIVDDFKYYEDGSDELKDTGEGTLLPLWKFQFERVKKHQVTDISWSQSVPDMFAVSYGSYSYTSRIREGLIVIYSLRNCAFPEHTWHSSKGCMSVDVHPTKNNLLAVALYDGNVVILIMKEDIESEPQSEVVYNIPTQMKHNSHAWNIKWNTSTEKRQPNFYSAGTDGRVIHWILESPDPNGLGGLFGTEIAVYKIPTAPIVGADGFSYVFTGGIQQLCFHPREKSSYLIGTSEGSIFVCSVTYGSRFYRYYRSHYTPVAGISWNYFHPDVFISCSEDWTIKIWDRRDADPMYVYEIGCPVMDVQWAPYSSTIFATATKDGRVMVYDLNVNKYNPVACQQVVTKKAYKLLRLRFNPFFPVIILGDNRGELNTLKLSPNCRIVPRDARGMILREEARVKFEIGKMKKILSLVRETNVKNNPRLAKMKNAKGVKTMQEIIEQTLANKKD